ncbi:leucine-rich repeat domain-containing protein [Prevotella falsenii]
MKQNYFLKKWSLLSMLLMLFVGNAMAQTQMPPENAPLIKMTVAKNKKVFVKFAANKDNTLIWLNNGGDGFQQVTINSTMGASQSFTSPSGTMYVYGDVTKMDCSKQYTKVLAIDASKNKLIEEITAERCHLTALDLLANTGIKKLKCGYNNITSIKLAPNSELQDIDLNNNRELAEVNFSDQTKLEKVNVNECGALTAMVFKNNAALKILYMNGTGMQKLDISDLSALEQFGGYGSKLTAAKFPTNAKNLSVVSLQSNLLDACALDDIFRALPKTKATEPNLGIEDNRGTTTCNTNIAKDKGWIPDVEGDGTGCATPIVPPADAPIITLTVVSNLDIKVKLAAKRDNTKIWVKEGNADFKEKIINSVLETGEAPVYKAVDATTIQFYGDITQIECVSNGKRFTAADFSKNPLLEVINIAHNALEALDLSANTKLKVLKSGINILNSVKFAANSDLEEVELNDNISLASIDLSAQSKLKTLNVSGCKALTVLNYDRSEAIQRLDVSETNLQKLDIEYLPNLFNLNAHDAHLTALKLPRSFANLDAVKVSDNSLDACELNRLYKSLPTVKHSTIKLVINGNPETTISHTKIATDKGWKVDVEGDGTGCENPTGIDAVEAAGINIDYNAATRKVTVSNAKANAKILLYTTNGTKVADMRTNGEGACTIALDNAAKGCYILVVDGVSHSFVVK